MYFCGVLLMLLVVVAPNDFQLCVLVGQNLKILSITLRRGLRFTCFQCSVASSIAWMNFLPSSWLTPAASRQSLIFFWPFCCCRFCSSDGVFRTQLRFCFRHLYHSRETLDAAATLLLSSRTGFTDKNFVTFGDNLLRVY